METIGYFVMVFEVIVWVIGVFFFLRSAFHFLKMFSHFRGKNHERFVTFLLPLSAPFLSELYTDQGNYHRRTFLSNFRWALVSAAIFTIVIFATNSINM